MYTKKALLLTAIGLGSTVPALADLALATAKNCMTCHMVERKVLGPSFKDVAAKYGDFNGVDPLNLPRPQRTAPTAVASPTDLDELRRELRKIILEELSAVRAA